MKRVAMIFLLTTGLAAGPAMADHNLFNRENVGGAIGAAIGGFAANKIVKGKGQAAATAAGAVGGFLLGKNFAQHQGYNGHSGYSAPRQYSGYTQSSGYSQNIGYQEHRGYSKPRSYKRSSGCCDYDSGSRYSISPIHETFMARCTSNVRAGPGTRYHVIGQVYEREPVQVVGKVNGRNWYKVRAGHRTGFIYAPLLRPVYYSQDGYGGDRW